MDKYRRDLGTRNNTTEDNNGFFKGIIIVAVVSCLSVLLPENELRLLEIVHIGALVVKDTMNVTLQNTRDGNLIPRKRGEGYLLNAAYCALRK